MADDVLQRYDVSTFDPGGMALRSGTTTLVAGVSPVISVAKLLPGSQIIASAKVMTTGASPTSHYIARAVDRTVGTPGSFQISAVSALGVVNVLDTSTVDWLLVR